MNDSNTAEIAGNVRYLTLGKSPSANEADWAHENLAGLPTLVTIYAKDGDKRHKVRHWQDEEGKWWRNAGQILVTWEEDSVQRFRIWLFRGATRKDLLWLRWVVEQAKSGAFGIEHGWRKSKLPRDYETWCYAWAMQAGGSKKEEPLSSPLIECNDPDCREDVHEDDLIIHTADVIEAAKWSVAVERFDDAKWGISLDCREPDMSVPEAASLASDIQWATATARQLNT